MLPSNYAILSSRFLVFLTSCLLVASCSIDMPKETQSSFETMTVKTSDIEIPIKYSARMKGQATNMYDAARAVIALYIALGGATR